MEKEFHSGFQLRVVSGKDKGQIFPLSFTQLVLGRKMLPEEEKTGWLLFSDPTVSRMHAVLEWDKYLQTYMLLHRSRTNSSLVNQEEILRQHLAPDDKIQLGELSLVYETARKQQLPEPETKKIDSGLKLLVIQGKNPGESFPLNRDLIILGKETQGEKSAPGRIRLDDPEIPLEQAYLLWNEKRKNFELFHHPKAVRYVGITRFLSPETPPQKIEVREKEPLKADDLLTAGNTTLLLRKEEIFVETGKAEFKAGAEKIPIKPPFSSLRKPIPLSPRPPAPAPAAPPPPLPVGTAAPFSGEQTAAWVAPAGYLLEIIEGKDQGNQYSLLKDALFEGKIITLGKKGRRNNDLELADRKIASEQARLEYSGGSLYLIAESPHFTTCLNEIALPTEEPVLLKSGDRIQMGETALEFFDRQSKEIIKGYQLKVIEGLKVDLNKSFGLESVTLVGRGPECQVRLSDNEISRVHLNIKFKEAKFWIEHKSSLNPTYVNGVSLPKGKERSLKNQDEIRISRKTLLWFEKTSE